MDQIYNVGSYDEISNIDLCIKLLSYLKVPHDTQEHLQRWIKHTRDRPFNDHRYAVDGTKLRKLGWEQKTSFSAGMSITVEWYKRFGEQWWGDISQVLTPFPIVAGNEIFASGETLATNETSDITNRILLGSKSRKADGTPMQAVGA